jgi:hypothetical protein
MFRTQEKTSDSFHYFEDLMADLSNAWKVIFEDNLGDEIKNYIQSSLQTGQIRTAKFDEENLKNSAIQKLLKDVGTKATKTFMSKSERRRAKK